MPSRFPSRSRGRKQKMTNAPGRGPEASRPPWNRSAAPAAMPVPGSRCIGDRRRVVRTGTLVRERWPGTTNRRTGTRGRTASRGNQVTTLAPAGETRVAPTSAGTNTRGSRGTRRKYLTAETAVASIDDRSLVPSRRPGAACGQMATGAGTWIKPPPPHDGIDEPRDEGGGRREREGPRRRDVLRRQRWPAQGADSTSAASTLVSRGTSTRRVEWPLAPQTSVGRCRTDRAGRPGTTTHGPQP